MVKPFFTVTSMVQRSNKTWSETKKEHSNPGIHFNSLPTVMISGTRGMVGSDDGLATHKDQYIQLSMHGCLYPGT